LYVAVPPPLKFTVNGLEDDILRVNVYTRFVAPSSATEEGETPTVTEGITTSSFRIVPVAADGLPIVYPVPLVTVKITVSLGSGDESAVGLTITWAVVLPAGITTNPEEPLKLAAPL
jgi:hypothetical protein